MTIVDMADLRARVNRRRAFRFARALAVWLLIAAVLIWPPPTHRLDVEFFTVSFVGTAIVVAASASFAGLSQRNKHTDATANRWADQAGLAKRGNKMVLQFSLAFLLFCVMVWAVIAPASGLLIFGVAPGYLAGLLLAMLLMAPWYGPEAWDRSIVMQYYSNYPSDPVFAGWHPADQEAQAADTE